MKTCIIHLDPQQPVKHQVLVKPDGSPAPEANFELTQLRLCYQEALAEENTEWQKEIESAFEKLTDEHRWEEDWLVKRQIVLMGSACAHAMGTMRSDNGPVADETLIMHPEVWKHWKSQHPEKTQGVLRVYYTCSECAGHFLLQCQRCGGTGRIDATFSGDYPSA